MSRTDADAAGASGELASGGTPSAGRPRRDSSSDASVDVGVLVAHSPSADRRELGRFADRVAADARGELRDATGIAWSFYEEDPTRLPDGSPHRPSDFLDEATLRMVEGPYDAVVVVTDVPLHSRRKRIVPGLASPVGRIVVVSTRRLVSSPRGEPVRSLDSPAVRGNAARLLLHLIGHVLDVDHDPDGDVMRPFEFDSGRREPGEFGPDARRQLRRIAPDIPDTTDVDEVRSPLGRLAFHAASGVRNLRSVARALVRNRAPLLPLSLPALTTAAVTPTLVLVFSAETWDVGIHLTDGVTALFASVSVLVATLYLTAIQHLFFPREPRRVLTEHMALVNVVVFCTVFAAVVGLFLLVGLLILGIEVAVFPPDLMTNWPTLEDPRVTGIDLVRTAAFISTIGVTTGALAGGLESRTVVRHLALFLDRP